MSEERWDRPGGATPEGATPKGASSDAGPFAMPSDARSRQRLITVAVLGFVLAALLAAAFVPRTLAEGGQGDQAWRLRAAPGVFSASVRFEGPDGSLAVPRSGAATLDQTRVWPAPTATTVGTIVAGPTPRDARSVRVTSLERGVGEAVVRRVLWRRVHVAVIDEAVTVTDLVAIGRDGQVVDVTGSPTSSDPVPGSEAEPGSTDAEAS